MDASTYARALGIGAVAGMRSMTAPAATLSARDHPFAGLAVAAAAGELVVDKLPLTPPRTLPGPLAVRALAGGLAGGAVAARHEDSRALGFAAGAAAAVASAFIFFELRRRLTEDAGVPDVAVALAEDALAVWAARAANA